jgi:hypothetical protein
LKSTLIGRRRTSRKRENQTENQQEISQTLDWSQLTRSPSHKKSREDSKKRRWLKNKRNKERL